MSKYPRHGLFITGTGTEVGKTFVGCLIATSLRKKGFSVGVYKPAASGFPVSSPPDPNEDPMRLWEAAGKPAQLDLVCPQRFSAPLAPHLSARAEGCEINETLLFDGLSVWRDECDIVLVEGAGGLMSPMSDSVYNADLAAEFGYPLVVVAANRLGVINDTLQTLITAATFRDGLDVAGIVLNDCSEDQSDTSRQSNADQIAQHSVPPLLSRVTWQQSQLDDSIDWFGLADKT